MADFDKNEKSVQRHLPRLKDLMSQLGRDPQAAANLATLHAELATKYREALKSFDKADPEAGKKVDKLVTGIDRPFTAGAETLFSSLAEQHNKVDALSLKMEEQAMTVCRATQLKVENLLDELINLNVRLANEEAKQATAASASAIALMFSTIGIGAVFMLVLGVFLAKSISKVLSALIDEATRLSQAAVEGKLQTRGNPELVSLEFRPIVEGVNDTLDAVIGPLNVAAEYVDRISKGDIPAKITDNYNGDFNEIKNNLNQCIDAVNGLIAEAECWPRPPSKASWTSGPTTAKYQGEYREIIRGMNDTLDAVRRADERHRRCLKRMANKDFTKPSRPSIPAISASCGTT